MQTAELKADATTLKRFFKEKFNIPVRVRSSSGKAGWVEVWIPAQLEGKEYVHKHQFPDELGDKCAEIVYPGRGWRWCGNIGKCGIAMGKTQWVALMASYDS